MLLASQGFATLPNYVLFDRPDILNMRGLPALPFWTHEWEPRALNPCPESVPIHEQPAPIPVLDLYKPAGYLEDEMFHLITGSGCAIETEDLTLDAPSSDSSLSPAPYAHVAKHRAKLKMIRPRKGVKSDMPKALRVRYTADELRRIHAMIEGRAPGQTAKALASIIASDLNKDLPVGFKPRSVRSIEDIIGRKKFRAPLERVPTRKRAS